MNLTLTRTSSSDQSTQGFLDLPDGTRLHTLELPWKDASGNPGGDADVSCVPPGTYQLALHDTPAHPKTFALVNPALGVIHEPDSAYPNARVACLIHIANFPAELEGCIGLGMGCGIDTVFHSATALGQFLTQVPWLEGHTLTIIAPT